MNDVTGMVAAARILSINAAYAEGMTDHNWSMLARRAGYAGAVTPDIRAAVVGELRDLEQAHALRVARDFFFGEPREVNGAQVPVGRIVGVA